MDVGIKSFAVSSDGVAYPNPKYLLARLHEHIATQRRDMQHKLSILKDDEVIDLDND